MDSKNYFLIKQLLKLQRKVKDTYSQLIINSNPFSSFSSSLKLTDDKKELYAPEVVDDYGLAYVKDEA